MCVNVCVCMCVCVCVCVYVCVRACVRVCVRTCMRDSARAQLCVCLIMYVLEIIPFTFQGLHLVTSHIWNTVLKTWIDNNCIDLNNSSLCTLLWNNGSDK